MVVYQHESNITINANSGNYFFNSEGICIKKTAQGAAFRTYIRLLIFGHRLHFTQCFWKGFRKILVHIFVFPHI
jgi:hypothetical protein